MVSVKDIKEALNYNPESGVFTWKIKSCKKVNIGDEAGCIFQSGYRVIGLYGYKVSAHRVAWVLFYGAYPDNEIDHINGIKADNRIINLRDVSRYENSKNRKKPTSNISGIMGVSYYKNKNGKKWRAKIKDKGINIHIGYFDDPETAEDAVKKRRSELGFHGNHGR